MIMSIYKIIYLTKIVLIIYKKNNEIILLYNTLKYFVINLLEYKKLMKYKTKNT